MKRFFLLLFVVVSFVTTCDAQYVEYQPFQGVPGVPDNYSIPFVEYEPYTPPPAARAQSPIQQYQALLVCDTSTGHHAEYTLNVGVRDGRVVIIYFDNGGSLHTGSNNSGYRYSGGELKETNYGGETYYVTKVNINYNNGSWQSFVVII